jgi:hypothetical protein
LVGGDNLIKVVKGIHDRVLSKELGIKLSYTGKGLNREGFISFNNLRDSITGRIIIIQKIVTI